MTANRYFTISLLTIFFAAACILLPTCANKQPKLYKYKKQKKEHVTRNDTRNLTKHLKK